MSNDADITICFKDFDHWEGFRNFMMNVLIEVDIMLSRSILAMSVSEQCSESLGTLQSTLLWRSFQGEHNKKLLEMLVYSGFQVII